MAGSRPGVKLSSCGHSEGRNDARGSSPGLLGASVSLPEEAGTGPAAVLLRFRREFHACLTARADELSELADAVLCAGTDR